MSGKETILTLNTPQETSLEVLFQNEVRLEIDVPVFHVQYGRDEICRYVDDVSKPELATYTSVKKAEAVKTIEEAVEMGKENIDRYKEENIKPELDVYLLETLQPTLQNYTDQTLKTDLQSFADNLHEEFNRDADEKKDIIAEIFFDIRATASIVSDMEITTESCQKRVETNAQTVKELTKIVEAHATSAQTYGLEAQKWAVGTIAECPEGSAKYWSESVNPDNFVRPGTVIMHPLSSLDGYLPCNGAAVSRTAYAKLYGIIGTTYGAGDGETTFNVPDFRGDFIRGFSEGVSSAIGERQEEGLPEITGWFAANTGWFNASNSGCFSSNGSASATTFANACTANVKTVYTMKASASSAVYGSSSHVTPQNQALNFFIKY